MTFGTEALTRYLLGESSPEERDRIEEDYFGDDDALARMQNAESALFEAYVEGQLSPERRQRFEQNYLSSEEGRLRVFTARQLASSQPHAQPASRSWRAPLAAAAAIILATGGYSLWRLQEGRSEPTPEVSRPVRRPDILLPAPPMVYELTEARTRSSAAAPSPLVIPQGTPTVSLRTPPLPTTDQRGYRVTIETPDGGAVFTATEVAPDPLDATRLRILVPAAALRDGDYIVKVASAAIGSAPIIAEYPLAIVNSRRVVK